MNTEGQKIILAGAFGCGRTTFIKKFPSKDPVKTIEIQKSKVDIHTIAFNTSAGYKSFKVYDSALHAKGGLPKSEFFRNTDACILFYDTTDKESYEKMVLLHDELIKSVGKQIVIPTIFVGTKVDAKREVALASVDFGAKGRDTATPYSEISSNANYNLKETFEMLIKEMFGAATQILDEFEPSSKSTAKVEDTRKQELADKQAEIRAAFTKEEDVNDN